MASGAHRGLPTLLVLVLVLVLVLALISAALLIRVIRAAVLFSVNVPWRRQTPARYDSASPSER